MIIDTETPLSEILINQYPDQWEKVISQKYVDIGEEFLGFTDTYKYISLLIPLHWTILDIGCAYCPQAYYFQNHKRYIGTDVENKIVFNFENSSYMLRSIKNVCKDAKQLNLKETFAILNYVPCNEENNSLIRETFPNLFCYYPHTTKIHKIDF